MLSTKQQEYLRNCNHRWNIKIGATGSGKSWLDYAYVIPHRLVNLRGEGAAVMIGYSQATLVRNVIEPMRQIWGDKLVSNIKSDNAAVFFGKRVYVLGADNKRRVSNIQGMTIEYAYGDEMTTWSESIFQMLKSRLRCKHSYFDGTANPDSPTHYIKQFLDSGADIYCQKSTIFDNPFLPKEFVDNLCKEYEGTVYYKRYILGEWALAEGLIYPMYEKAIEDPPTEDENGEKIEPTDFCMSLDYGTENPLSAHIYAKYGDVWYAVAEYYYKGRELGRTKTDYEYADDMETFTEPYREKLGKRKLEIIIDPSAASFKAELRRRTGLYRIRDADNNVQDGVRETATCLQNGKVKISKKCVEMIKELGGYIWDKNESPVKENDHAMDDLRYFCKTKRLTKIKRGADADISRLEFL